MAIININNRSVLVMLENFGKEFWAIFRKIKKIKATIKRSEVITLKLVLLSTYLPKTVDAPQKKAATKASEIPMRLKLKASSAYVFGMSVGNEIR